MGRGISKSTESTLSDAFNLFHVTCAPNYLSSCCLTIFFIFRTETGKKFHFTNSILNEQNTHRIIFLLLAHHHHFYYCVVWCNIPTTHIPRTTNLNSWCVFSSFLLAYSLWEGKDVQKASNELFTNVYISRFMNIFELFHQLSENELNSGTMFDTFVPVVSIQKEHHPVRYFMTGPNSNFYDFDCIYNLLLNRQFRLYMPSGKFVGLYVLSSMQLGQLLSLFFWVSGDKAVIF